MIIGPRLDGKSSQASGPRASYPDGNQLFFNDPNQPVLAATLWATVLD